MGSIVKAITGIFKTPKMPKIETPVMPDPGSTTAKIAATKKIQERKKSGREGTIFGGAYQNANLGGTA
jgi:hypothetical protein